MVRATEVTHVEIEEGAAGAGASSGHGVNRILDDALEAFIEVLDQHTIADMAKSQARAAAAATQAARRAQGAHAGAAGRARAALQRRRLIARACIGRRPPRRVAAARPRRRFGILTNSKVNIAHLTDLLRREKC